MEIRLTSTEDTKKLAQKLAKHLIPNTVVALYGDLGAGKTTFTGFLVEALSIDARVQSPTFVLVREYKKDSEAKNTGINLVNHIDLYRLQSKEEVYNLGIEDIIKRPNSITVIEWPELLDTSLPDETVKIRFEETGENERNAYVQNLH